jgi:peptide chain release factor 1
MSRLAIELRPGEGGDDAFAFCQELRSAIVAFARRRCDPVRFVESPPGGRTLLLVVLGDRPSYERLAGVHRIQRIPKNDRRGRRHTSTATIAVIEEQAQTTVEVADEDVDVSTYRGHGKGGQHRNKTDSAVRLVHRPTKTVVVVEHGRSQWQNLRQARGELARRLEESARRKDSAKVLSDRNRQIASGERPVKQFTHNEQRSIVESHETGEAWRWSDFYRGRLDRDDGGSGGGGC